MTKIELKKEDFEVFWSMTVRYYELDPQGIVHNANHAAFYDQAGYAYFKHVNYDYTKEMKESNQDFHTVQITIGYYKPLYLDDEIVIGVKPKEAGNSSLTFLMGMFLSDSDELVGTCEVVWVYTDLDTKKSVSIPEDKRAKLLGEKI